MGTSEESSECPVKKTSVSDKSSSCPVRQNEPSSNNSIFKWIPFWSTSDKPAASSPNESGGKYNPKTNDYIFDDKKDTSQLRNLHTVRAVSSIPKGEFMPSHQPGNVEKWVYPSEQQYFNAMKKKGYNPREEDVPVVLAIHNMVNEEAWSKIKAWEALHNCTSPKLARFTGRPKDISPKAYLRSLFGYTLPFDRHDWLIDRNGTEIRYVIDFYKGAQPKVDPASPQAQTQAPIALYMDVRPALDSFSALYDRAFVTMQESFFGNNLLINSSNTHNSNSKYNIRNPPSKSATGASPHPSGAGAGAGIGIGSPGPAEASCAKGK